MMRFFRRDQDGDRAATGQALNRTRSSWFGRLGSIFAREQITTETWETLEEVLIGADTGVQTTLALLDRVRAARPANASALHDMLRDELLGILQAAEQAQAATPWGGTDLAARPLVVLIVGVNGTGKTTTLARLAHLYQQRGDRVLAVAGDTFRAAAIDQLRTWGQRLGFDVIAHQQGADPAAVVFDGIEAARARGVDVVLIDTAGRLHNKQNLMDELGKIRRVIERHLGRGPDEVALVLDATTGQNGLAQARAFTELVDVTSVVLTKLDGTAKGGIVFAIATDLQLPVRFIGTGEGPGDFAPFDPQQFVDALLTTSGSADT